MLKNISQLEYVIAGKVFHFACDMDSELHLVKEALCQFMKFVGNIEDQLQAQKQAPEGNVPPSIPVSDVSKPEEQKAA
jgi:ABC-type glycerol-3-phosphate transport system substrate-binding protein